ncbi:8759_t:CDS:2 [Paraglomus occultum]|uniref:8759_t:CDS:1 n=1 Tax=Paraglomus occultum TaxID=144539 RepID=A0A9N8VVU3_9GLOM|nr:8759_t:CDS:2 [Paraglomus occultum]
MELLLQYNGVHGYHNRYSIEVLYYGNDMNIFELEALRPRQYTGLFLIRWHWKESVDVLREVTLGIVDVLSDTWKNSAFSSEFAESISEGTYVSNVIVPAIRASLKNVPLEKSSFVSTSERQSSASADRKGKGRLGRRPDIMFVIKLDDRLFELMYAECLRLICTKTKEIDEVKLWRECNDGMYYVR